jgi:hypothetical protein
VGKNGPDANTEGRPHYKYEARIKQKGGSDKLTVELQLN